jgi:hypothetical protein
MKPLHGSRAVAAVVLGWLLAAPGCGEGPVSPSASQEQPTLKLSSAHFRVMADRVGFDVINAITQALEFDYPRFTADLRVGDLPVTSVWLWQDEDSFYADMASRGSVYRSGGYVRDAHAIALLELPNASLSQITRAAVHEFAHVVSMAVNPSIANNPRWLWETVAVYENREFVDPTTLDYMRAGRYPSLVDLDADWNVSHQVYQVGAVLAEYIVHEWGMDGLLRLIRTNGNVPEALRVSVPEFEAGWRAYLHQKYGLPG